MRVSRSLLVSRAGAFERFSTVCGVAMMHYLLDLLGVQPHIEPVQANWLQKTLLSSAFAP
jgi:hypothetical protein